MKKLTEYINLALSFKTKYIDEILQITICEHNKAVGKIRCNIVTHTIEYIKIDEYNRHSMFATILLRKLFVICKESHLITTLNMSMTTRQYELNKDAIISICNKFNCDKTFYDDTVSIVCNI